MRSKSRGRHELFATKGTKMKEDCSKRDANNSTLDIFLGVRGVCEVPAKREPKRNSYKASDTRRGTSRVLIFKQSSW